jgi:ABC-type phosphate transport system substrate-binding protein
MLIPATGMKAFAEGVDDLIFIVHASNPSSEISSNDIRDYYFKKKRHWPSGESVRFIDRGLTSHIHDVFVKNILRKSNSDVELFWIGQKLYTGDSAPLRENSDASTIQFVSAFKGAIGYVSSSATISDPNVKMIKVNLPARGD